MIISNTAKTSYTEEAEERVTVNDLLYLWGVLSGKDTDSNNED